MPDKEKKEALIYGFRDNHTDAKATEVVITDEKIDTGFTPPLISCKGGSAKKSEVSMFPNGIIFDEYATKMPLSSDEAALLNKFRSK